MCPTSSPLRNNETFQENNAILIGEDAGTPIVYLVGIEAGLGSAGVTKKGVCTAFLSLAHSLSFLPTAHGTGVKLMLNSSEKILHVCFRHWQLAYVLSIQTGLPLNNNITGKGT